MRIVWGKEAAAKLKAIDIELAVARYLNPRQNLIVPNVHWGLNIHECDLLVITASGYGWEIEIKVSKADLKKDMEKRHGHYDGRIKYLYYAIPDYLMPAIEHLPARAGIITVDKDLVCRTIKSPKNNSQYKFSADERYQVARLGALRILGLKDKIIKARDKSLTP